MSSGVSNGQQATDTTFNQAFIARNGDSNTTGKLDLQNVDVLSGPDIINLQKNINALCSALGISTNQAKDLLITWANTVVGLSASSAVDKIEALVNRFLASGGHTHDGTDGEGPQINALDSLSNINKFFTEWQEFQTTGTSGLTAIVTSHFTTKTPSGGDSQAGVITTGSNARVYLIDLANGTFVTDPEGQTVYAYLSFTTDWILTFYTNEAGTETPYNLPSTNLLVMYREVFTLETRPTTPSSPFLFGTLDISSEVPDASISLAGKVNITTQTFGGNKTFNGNLTLLAQLMTDFNNDTSATGANATVTAPTKVVKRLSNGSLTSVDMISSPTAGQFMVLINNVGADIAINNLTGGTAANQINTGTGSALTLTNQASIWLWYDITSTVWRIIGGSGSGGGAVGVQEFLGGVVNGTNDTFGPFSDTPSSDESILIYVDSVLKDKTTYAVVGASIVFNAGEIPQTGQDVYAFYLTSGIPTPPPTPSGTLKTEYRTITSLEASNKKIILTGTPSVPNDVLVDVLGGGGAQEFNVDYTIVSNEFRWTGYTLDGVLAQNDKVRFHYLI